MPPHVPKKRQAWYSFKKLIKDHYESTYHKDAIRSHEEQQSQQLRKKQVTKRLVAIAIQCILSRTAADHFVEWVSCANFLGADVGDIGHSK